MPSHPHSSLVILKTDEFAFKATETNDDPAMTSFRKEQNPAKTSQGNLPALLQEGCSLHINRPIFQILSAVSRWMIQAEIQCWRDRFLLISVTTTPSSVSASHGSVSLRHKISSPLDFCVLLPEVPWQSAGEVKAPKQMYGSGR